jgi:inosose dehydratase
MSNASIRVANAPCSWGVLEFADETVHRDERKGAAGDVLKHQGASDESEGKKAGAALQEKTATYERVLDEIKESGYAGTELGDWGFMPTDAKKLRAEMNKRSFSLLGAFVPVDLCDQSAHEPGAEIAVRTARLLSEAQGTEALIVLADENGKNEMRTRHAGRIKEEHGLSPQQWLVFSRGVEHIARRVLEETRCKTVFHHHCAGFIETPDEIDRLLELTDPALVGLCLDTGHYAFGGGVPVDAFHQYYERIWHVHFKDCSDEIAQRARSEQWDYFTAVRNGVFCELGQGIVNFPALLSNMRQAQYDGWVVVEQDVLPGMGTPLESARRNREYLASLGL